MREAVLYDEVIPNYTRKEGCYVLTPLPHYLSTTLPRKVMRDMTRFRLSCHTSNFEVGGILQFT